MSSYQEAFSAIEKAIQSDTKRGDISPAMMGEALHKLWLIAPQTEADRPYHRLMDGERIMLAGNYDDGPAVWIRRNVSFPNSIDYQVRYESGVTSHQMFTMYPCESPAAFAVRVYLDATLATGEPCGMPFGSVLVVRAEYIDSSTIRFRRGSCRVMWDNGWTVVDPPNETIHTWERIGVTVVGPPK